MSSQEEGEGRPNAAPVRQSGGLTLPYRSDAAQAVPDARMLACQHHGAAAVPGWFSRWLPWMAQEVDPPAPPHRLDR
jgi:hypothetical protein